MEAVTARSKLESSVMLRMELVFLIARQPEARVMPPSFARKFGGGTLGKTEEQLRDYTLAMSIRFSCDDSGAIPTRSRDGAAATMERIVF